MQICRTPACHRVSTSPLAILAIHDESLRTRVRELLREAGLAHVVVAPPDLAARPAPAGDAAELLIGDAATGRPGDESWAVACDGIEPLARLELIASGVRRLIDVSRTRRENVRHLRAWQASPAGASRPETLDDLWTTSPPMRRMLSVARRVAHADSSLLLTGETGVGKEHLARAVHASSRRSGRPFVVVNCGALPESLLESQLFGHERGAFTGADRKHRGFFEVADGGTILLDEIGEMPTHLQVKLLSVLERREIVRIGGTETIPVDVRLMAATNRDPQRAVEAGEFRADLFYRLNVVHLDVPPLRTRVADLPDLVGGFLRELGTRRSGASVRSVSPDAWALIERYKWPGNVRELRNAVERAVILGRDSRIQADDLPSELSLDRGAKHEAPSGQNGEVPSDWLSRPISEVRRAAADEAERRYLEQLLIRTAGRIAETAERAGICPRSLYDKMKRHGLRKEDYRRSKRARARARSAE